jgi:hypothetical protein
LSRAEHASPPAIPKGAISRPTCAHDHDVVRKGCTNKIKSRRSNITPIISSGQNEQRSLDRWKFIHRAVQLSAKKASSCGIPNQYRVKYRSQAHIDDFRTAKSRRFDGQTE